MGDVRESAGRRGALTLCLALLAAALPGAGAAQPAHAGQGQPAARVPTVLFPNSIVREDRAFAMTLATSPSPIRLNEPFELTILIRPLTADARGALSATVDARMPAHSHGMNTRPQREPLGDDQFRFRGLLFHMAGEWELVIDVAQGRARDRGVVRLVIE